MEPQKIPAEAVDLYTRYIHGEVSRRDFFGGVSRYAVGGLTVTAIVEALMPNYALGQQVARTDERISASYETVPSPDGNGFIRGYLVRPFGADSRSETPDRLPGVLVIHENRGLNPHTEDVARRFALANFMAFAPDALTSVGGYPNDDYRGGQLFGEVDRGRMAQDFVAAARWLKARPDCNGRIGVTGFCFGGGMSIQPGCAGWGRIWQRPPRSMAAPPRGERAEDQRGDAHPSRRPRHATRRDLSRIRGSNAECRRHA